jgi:hypothetical protein
MYSTIPHLRSAIQQALFKGELCRIYRESLRACWPNLADPDRRAAITQFAAQNRWEVSFREVTGLGELAEFRKQQTGSRLGARPVPSPPEATPEV